MGTVNALAQISALLQILEQEGIISHADRCLLENCVPDPGYEILWPEEEIYSLLEKIAHFSVDKSHETRSLDALPSWSQETLASLQVVLANIPEPRRSFLFFIMLEIHWSCR